MTREELIKEAKVLLRWNGFRSVKSDMVFVAENFEVRTKFSKKTYMPSIDIEYRFLWTGEIVPDIDPNADMHLVASFGGPSAQALQDTLDVLDPATNLPDEHRIGMLASILKADLEAWNQVGASGESFFMTYRSSMSLPAQPYLAYGPAWLPRRQQS